MVIECRSCQARYWMKESLMKGVKGAKVRCRKCGATFVVVSPVTVPDAPDPANRGIRARARQDPHPPKETEGTAGGGGKGSPRADAVQALLPSPDPGRPHPTPTEKDDPAPPVPDNVYSLNSFREGRPKRSPAGGYDISGTVRPWPSVFPEEERPADTSPLSAPCDGKREMRNILLEEPIRWKIKGTSGPSDANPGDPPHETKILELSPPDRSQIKAGPTSSYTRITNIAIVYLLLLVLGGCGYLIVYVLSLVLNGESG